MKARQISMGYPQLLPNAGQTPEGGLASPLEGPKILQRVNALWRRYELAM